LKGAWFGDSTLEPAKCDILGVSKFAFSNGSTGGGRYDEVRIPGTHDSGEVVYKSNAVHPSRVKAPGFKPWTYKVKKLVSKLVFKWVNFVPLRGGAYKLSHRRMVGL
jgi:hypothetical protein